MHSRFVVYFWAVTSPHSLLGRNRFKNLTTLGIISVTTLPLFLSWYSHYQIWGSDLTSPPPPQEKKRGSTVCLEEPQDSRPSTGFIPPVRSQAVWSNPLACHSPQNLKFNASNCGLAICCGACRGATFTQKT